MVGGEGHQGWGAALDVIILAVVVIGLEAVVFEVVVGAEERAVDPEEEADGKDPTEQLSGLCLTY